MNDIEKIVKDIEEHLLKDEKPSEYINELFKNEEVSLKNPFSLLTVLKTIEQSPIHHAEGDVWIHTMMVVDEAAKLKNKSKDPKVFMWAALLHDLGKAETTKVRKGKITAYNHDIKGEELVYKFFQNIEKDLKFVEDVAHMVRWHMQVLFVIKDMPHGNLPKMLEQVDYEEVGLLALADRLGRGKMSEDKEMSEKKNIEIFKSKCKNFLDLNNRSK